MSRRILEERRTLFTTGVLLVFGVLLAGCRGSEDEYVAVPPSPEAADNVVIRVSGTEGVAFSGTYGTIEGMLQEVDDDLGNEPTEYEVEVQEGVADGVTAGFQKTQPGEGELEVEILADDQVIVESRTLAEFGAVNADWFPPLAPTSVLPPEDEQFLPGDGELTSEDNT